MAECDFSWFKMASFFGAALLVLIAFMLVANGINLIVDGATLYGVASIVGGLLSGVATWLVYRNYQKKGNKA